MRLRTVPLVDLWARQSQQQARRNAMVATTELTRRRIERDEVEAYLAGHTTRHEIGHESRATAAVATR